MGLINKIKGWFSMVLETKAQEEFKVDSVLSNEMEAFINECANIYKGSPRWIDEEEHIKTINFAKSICSETARLTTLATNITIDGSARAEWLQNTIDSIYFQLRHWVEYGCAYGTIILKPSMTTVDVVTPDDFIPTEVINGEIRGAVFINREKRGKDFYTRLEYHHFDKDDDKLYVIENKCYKGKSKDDTAKSVNIDDTPWKGMLDYAEIPDMDKPLFGVLRMPEANNVEIDSPMGMPVFAEAIEELKDLDVAYSRNALEILRSKKVVLMDADRLLPGAQRTPEGFDHRRESMGLPDYIQIVEAGADAGTFYQEITPELNTLVRVQGINTLLSQIGYKCGFANGYFVFNEKSGIATATQIEADQQRTIQFVKDMRDKLESCLDGVIYALDVFADLYDLAPLGEYEVTYDFGDITYSREEDRVRWWQYVLSGKVPAWMYFNKFEGMSEEDAQKMEQEMLKKQMEASLFGAE